MENKLSSPPGATNIDTNFGYTLSLIKSKYVMNIMYWLTEYKPVMRFNELKRCLQTISFKSLSNTLKQMEIDQLIIRKEYPEIPPKVEYSLTERGQSLMPILEKMCDWGKENSILSMLLRIIKNIFNVQKILSDFTQYFYIPIHIYCTKSSVFKSVKST